MIRCCSDSDTMLIRCIFATVQPMLIVAIVSSLGYAATMEHHLDPFKNFTPRGNEKKAADKAPPRPPLLTPLAQRSATDMMDAASLRTDLSIAALEAVVRDGAAKDSDRIAAANALLDRAHGKPIQQNVTRVVNTIDMIALGEELRQIAKRYDQRIGIELINQEVARIESEI